ncbi:MAG TPA: hypothetical protein VFU07_08065 [Candidatus Lumbricidophila sp.]|nr:hypothetical protein [Candidatus Lumbricidophila sp.]
MTWRLSGRDVSAAEVARLARAWRASGLPLLVIDGPSGAGKSTLAAALAAASGAPVVALDSVYPGWGGLRQGSVELGRTLIRPHRAGRLGWVQRWDWEASARGIRIAVKPGGPLIVEGCGAFAAAGRPAFRVWVILGDAERRRRALDRDGGAYEPFWATWEAQWRRYRRAIYAQPSSWSRSSSMP